MARPVYIQFPNASYHIAARGINRQALFLDAEDSNVFIGILRKVVFQFNLKLFAFCLMTNHYHLYLSTPEANLSKAIKALNQRYAVYFLAKYKDKDGTVFKGRYMRRLVEDEVYSLNLIAYVHNNPYKLVEKIEYWSYSSYPSYLCKEKRFDFIDYDWVWAQFARSTKSFIEFHDYMRKIDWNPDHYTIAKTFIAGEGFARKIIEQHLDFDLIDENEVTGIKEIKKNFNEDNFFEIVDNMNLKNRDKLKLKIYLLREFTNNSSKQVAVRFTMTAKNISRIHQDFKRKLKIDKNLKKLINDLLKTGNYET
jgi:putative transposase